HFSTSYYVTKITVPLQSYVRDSTAGRLHNLDVNILPYARLFGCDDDTVYMQHSIIDSAIVLEQVDTLVLSRRWIASLMN
ncbi:MAG: hypothetical protein ACKVJ2_11550, partial [Pseudomonadales bacterium]